MSMDNGPGAYHPDDEVPVEIPFEQFPDLFADGNQSQTAQQGADLAAESGDSILNFAGETDSAEDGRSRRRWAVPVVGVVGLGLAGAWLLAPGTDNNAEPPQAAIGAAEASDTPAAEPTSELTELPDPSSTPSDPPATKGPKKSQSDKTKPSQAPVGLPSDGSSEPQQPSGTGSPSAPAAPTQPPKPPKQPHVVTPLELMERVPNPAKVARLLTVRIPSLPRLMPEYSTAGGESLADQLTAAHIGGVLVGPTGKNNFSMLSSAAESINTGAKLPTDIEYYVKDTPYSDYKDGRVKLSNHTKVPDIRAMRRLKISPVEAVPIYDAYFAKLAAQGITKVNVEGTIPPSYVSYTTKRVHRDGKEVTKRVKRIHDINPDWAAQHVAEKVRAAQRQGLSVTVGIFPQKGSSKPKNGFSAAQLAGAAVRLDGSHQSADALSLPAVVDPRQYRTIEELKASTQTDTEPLSGLTIGNGDEKQTISLYGAVRAAIVAGADRVSVTLPAGVTPEELTNKVAYQLRQAERSGELPKKQVDKLTLESLDDDGISPRQFVRLTK